MVLANPAQEPTCELLAQALQYLQCMLQQQQQQQQQQRNLPRTLSAEEHARLMLEQVCWLHHAGLSSCKGVDFIMQAYHHARV
jgi:hypothetical protein